MNHDCNGDYFSAEGIQYYRCHAGSTVITTDVTEYCPNCGRYIRAELHGNVRLLTVTEKIAVLPNGRQIIMSRSES